MAVGETVMLVKVPLPEVPLLLGMMAVLLLTSSEFSTAGGTTRAAGQTL